MPGLYYAQVCLAADSSIPEDVAINGWHFEVDGDVFPVSGALTDEQVITGERNLQPDENGIHGDLSDFYQDIGGLLSSQINPVNSRIKWYNLSLPAPRVPLLDLPMDNFTTTGTNSFPHEVAVVGSFFAAPLSGVNQATRRNRVFLGPLSQSADAGGSGRPTSATRTTIADAMVNFAGNSENEPGWTWVVYSPTTQVSAPVEGGWVDNAFDTQRRRGVEASVRENWTASSI